MPYFHLGGSKNNPYIQAPKHKYSVKERFRIDIDDDSAIEKGLTSIYELKPL